jgi:hypothetical protein
MSDTKIYDRAARSSPAVPPSEEKPTVQRNGGTAEIEAKNGYFAASPNGTQVPIPKELYVAFSDFIKTRKCPGSIAIQFRSGEITCVEALARKTYRPNS